MTMLLECISRICLGSPGLSKVELDTELEAENDVRMSDPAEKVNVVRQNTVPIHLGNERRVQDIRPTHRMSGNKETQSSVGKQHDTTSTLQRNKTHSLRDNQTDRQLALLKFSIEAGILLCRKW
jgi:hypothetical protein